MMTVAIELSEAKVFLEEMRREGGGRLRGLWEWARGFAGRGLEALLRMELAILLEREQAQGVVNWRNGYRGRTLSLAGLGQLGFLVPRDRLGHYRSELLPFRKRRTEELEKLAAEMFLAGLSTRDVARVLERHFGERFDSKEISRMAGGVAGELDAWRRRDLSGAKYRFLFLDGANFKVRRNRQVERLPFLAVIGARSADDKLEVLAIELGDKERKDLWAELFQDLIRRGLDPDAVELGVMDGLPGLEDAFRAAFSNAATQRCQVHAKRNALKRVGLKQRAAFSADLDRVFYAPNEAQGRSAFVNLKGQWARDYPSAVGIIERDLDSLLRFYRFEPKYWASLRTTNPIERLNKEFKRRTKAMEITGGEQNTYRLLAYVALTMNLGWRSYVLSLPKPFYTLKAA
jgi:putative transposase